LLLLRFTHTVRECLALPDRWSGVKLALEQIQPLIPTGALYVSGARPRMSFSDKLKTKPLKRICIEIFNR
jgi:hypothetical protein